MTNGPQVVYLDKVDTKAYTDENSLATAFLTQPDTINAVVTHLGGRESDKFPLTFLTEGQVGGASYEEINDAQFQWPVQRRAKKADYVVSSQYNNTSVIGGYNQSFYLCFKTNLLIEQTPIVSTNGYKAIILAPPVQVGTNSWRYELQSAVPGQKCPLSECQPGIKWAMTGNSLVSESHSMGNRSTRQTPGKMKNQLSFFRKSYEYGGNMANKVVEVTFMTEGGTKTTKWMDYEEWTHQMNWKENIEEHMWEAMYNRDAQGVVHLKDRNSGKPVPIGAGVIQQIPNIDTYGELTYKKLNQIIGDVAYGATDKEKMEFVLYCGEGFMDDFDQAMKGEMKILSPYNPGTFVQGTGNNLVFGGSFKQYVHRAGHLVTLKHMPMLEYGGRAQVAPIHPISGKPMTSHEAYFIDQSNYDGQRNVKMICQKGRSFRRGIVKGMSPLNGETSPFGNNDFKANNFIATEQDANSIHFLGSKTVNISRNEHCLKLTCTLS